MSSEIKLRPSAFVRHDVEFPSFTDVTRGPIAFRFGTSLNRSGNARGILVRASPSRIGLGIYSIDEVG
jgi:hypothetical protein